MSSVESRFRFKPNYQLFRVKGTEYLDLKLDRIDNAAQEQNRSKGPA